MGGRSKRPVQLDAQGLQGLQGLHGLQGLAAAQGLQGLQGLHGLQGLAAAHGLQGLQGLHGVTASTAALASSPTPAAVLQPESAAAPPRTKVVAASVRIAVLERSRRFCSLILVPP
jgi:hypothetical protein